MANIKRQVRDPILAAACERALCAALVLAILLALALIAVPSARAQTFTVLHKFTGGWDGGYPSAGVIVDASGNLYGVTQDGGSFNFGTVFQLDATGHETVLHSFLGGDGLTPVGGLIRDKAGNLYGTTWDGGETEEGACEHGCGTVFKVGKTGKETVLYAFTGGTDGGNPNSTLIRDKAGNLYGTTYLGGFGYGVIFKVDRAGNETVLYDFEGVGDGVYPLGVIRDGAGNFYGMTAGGGTDRQGDVFKLDTSGNLTVLYSFTGKTDGAYPTGGLLRDAAGNLYGTTAEGGDLSCYLVGCGVVFKLDTTGVETVLYAFTGANNGSSPNTLILDKAGNFYGTTSNSGPDGDGTVFELDANGNQTVLHSFVGTDGIFPNGLTMDGAGNLYGTTAKGGRRSCLNAYGCGGVVFKLSP